MQQKRLLAALVLILGLSFAMLPPAAGYTAKSAGQTKKGGGAKKGGAGAGAKVFADNCATCHDGGNNSVEPTKTLHIGPLKENGFNGPDDIKQRVKEGKAIMPSFADQLKPAEIDAVAAYVWGQAQKDWK